MNALFARMVSALLLALPAAAALAQAPEEAEAVLLIATAQLGNSSFRQTVILAVPYSNDRHVGVILNRPTRQHLASLFPEHEPSKKIAEPVFFGGPMSPRAIFAVVHSSQSPGGSSIPLMKDVFLALTMTGVDRVIEEHSQAARFYVGNVVWRPGELREELGDGYWHVLNVDPELLFRKNTEGLWGELSRLARAVRASAGGASAPAHP